MSYGRPSLPEQNIAERRTQKARVMARITNEALRQAYLDTVYRVIGWQQPIDIRIGQCHPPLDTLLSAHRVNEWAFITASNPQSRALPARDNARRNTELKRYLYEAGWCTADAVGFALEGDWPPEHSVLVLGMGREAALALARRWQQKAIVYGTIRQPAELVWID